MIDIIAYSLVALFLFLSSLAIIDVKARLKHKPETALNSHEKTLVDNASTDKEQPHNIEINRIPIDNPSTEHTMMQKTEEECKLHPDSTETVTSHESVKSLTPQGISPRSCEMSESSIRASRLDLEAVPSKPEQKNQPIEEDELDKLINEFEAEISKIKHAHQQTAQR